MSKPKRISKWASVVPSLDLGISRYLIEGSSRTYMCVCLNGMLSARRYNAYLELWDALKASQDSIASSVVELLHKQGHVPVLENVITSQDTLKARVIVGKAYWTGVRDRIVHGTSSAHALHRHGVAYVKQALADLPDDDFKAWLHSQPI